MASSILASVSVVLGAEIGEFKAKMAEARKELSGLLKFGEGAKDIGESLSKYVTLPLLALGGAGVKMAGDLEKATASFTTLLGSAEAAQATLSELKAFAADTPFEFPEVQDAAKKLLAFNTPAKELKETLRQLGDVSAGIDAPIGEIAELFGKARVQGRLFQEDINQLTGRGIPIIQELAKQFGVSEAGVRKLVESGKVNFGNLQTAFADLTKEGGKFGGLMEKQSQTLPGLFSSLKDNVGQALAGISTDLIAALDLKGVVKSIGDFVQRASAAFAGLSPEVKKLIFVGAGLAAALGPVLVALGSVITILPALQAGFAVLGVSSLAAFTPLLLPIAAIAAGATLIYENWNQLRPVFSAAADSIGESISRIKEAIGGIRLGEDTGDLLKGLNLVQTLVNEIAAGVQGLADTFNGVVRFIASLLNGDLRGAMEGIKTTAEGLLTPLANLFGFSKKTTFDDFFHLRDAVIAADEAAGAAALTGGDLQAALDAEGAAAGKAAGLNEDMAKALASVLKNLRDVVNINRALGDVYDLVDAKQSALESGIRTLVTAGFAPASREVTNLVLQLQKLPGLLGAVSQLSAKGITLTGPKADVLPIAVKAPKLEGDAYLKPYYDREDEAALKFTQNFQQLLANGMANAGEVLGTALGSVISGTQSLGEGLRSVFDGLLSIVGDFIIQYGKLLITQGTLEIASALLASNPLTAGAAIGVGIAAIAVGSAIKGLSGGGNRSTTGGGVSIPNTANVGQANPTVLTVKVVNELKLRGEELYSLGKVTDYRRLRTA